MATILKRKNKFYDGSRFGQPQIRVYHRKGTGKKSPRYLLKCGCCDEKIEIYYGEDGLEIGGVNGAVEDWREILLPLLLIKHRKMENSKTRKREWNESQTKRPGNRKNLARARL